ncbi:hypothetical protein AB0C59_24025 [Streptomyces sp. NPDC048664]|uniref:hypothetical protein n=1 Tax=Streptomyces sp. NPDC048664 TaxID=3154505 RepID=UPI003423F102
MDSSVLCPESQPAVAQTAQPVTLKAVPVVLRMVARHVVVLVGPDSYWYTPLLKKLLVVMPPPVTTVPAGQLVVTVQKLSAAQLCGLETCW